MVSLTFFPIIHSEFDVVAIIVHVGEVFATAQQKKQWIFVVDGFVSESHSEGISNSLLAISFCSQYADDDSFVPMNSNLTGSTVCKFCFLCFFLFFFFLKSKVHCV